jgi:hypothetical protein
MADYGDIYWATLSCLLPSPFRIKVSGRIRHYINAFGEELIAENTDRAISIACEQTGAVVNDYTAAPVYFDDDENGAHQWLIEFENEPERLDHFTYELTWRSNHSIVTTKPNVIKTLP